MITRRIARPLCWRRIIQISALSTFDEKPSRLAIGGNSFCWFSGALANPLLASESAVNRLNGTLLEEFVAENYTAPRIVLAASGVEHEELLSIAEPLLSDLPSVPRPEEPKSVYTGGDYRCQSETGRTHFALAFELPGGWHNLKDAMVLTVLQMLLGGGGSFSAGGPGKGMYSRLYLRVLNEYPQVHSISAFNNIYNNTGIFGIQVTTGSDFVSKAIDIAANEILTVATSGQVDQVQLDRAKLSCLISISVNFSTFLVIGKTSPVTYQVLGHLKTCLVLAFGYTLLQDPFSWRNIMGILLAMVGMILYSYYCTLENQQKAVEAAAQASQAREGESDPFISMEKGSDAVIDPVGHKSPVWNKDKD